MKKIWIVESSAGRKWNVAASLIHFKKKDAKKDAKEAKVGAPGLKWRVARYVREVRE